MVTNNKVLTVSYGTFSCTLEGFEESFDTMKAIAEYFRDLAADDRYFGAEPPTPDAEMLARIAEKEIARRVSARLDHGAIVLSASDPESESQASPQADAAAQTPAAQASAAPSPVQTRSAPPVVTAPQPEAEAATASVTQDAPSETPQDTQSAEQPADTIGTDELTDEPAETPEPPEQDIAEGITAEIAEDAIEDAPAADMPVTDLSEAVLEEAPTEEETSLSEATLDAALEAELDTDMGIADSVLAAVAEDSVAEDAPVAGVEASPAPENAMSEAPDVALDLDSIAAAVSAVDALSDDQLASDDAAVPSDLLVLEDTIEDGEDPFAEPSPVAEEDVAETALDWEDDSPEYEENSIAAKLERIRAVVARVETTPEDTLSSEDGQPELRTEDLSLTEAPSHASDDLTETHEDTDVAPQEASDVITPVKPKVRPLRARVVRMKKADFEEAVAAGTLEAEAVETAPTDQPAPSADTSSLTPEDEADLLAELAQVEAELKVSDDTETDATAADNMFAEDENDTAETQVRTASKATARPEPDLSRLMAKADTEMEEPAGKGRRSAIAHLRAAVAATRAEKRAGKAGKSKDDTIAYRDDLASVVRAVPGGKGAGAERADKPAVAPLKLVPSQRVDTPEAAAPEQSAQSSAEEPQKAPRRVPVRPRRVSSDQLDRAQIARPAAPVSSSNATLSGFSKYAASIGATQLPESIEAAAAYLTYVEGLKQFSRPMLMRMSREVNIPQFTREMGLRSFGQLLREKKIEKLEGGRFTANASINFKPEDREVG